MKLSDDDHDAIADRFANAIALAMQEGIYCTGSPSQPLCENPALCGIRLHTQLFALPCIEHIEEVLNAIFAKRHGSCVTISLAELLEVHGETFKSSAAYIRERNQAANTVTVPDMPKSR